MTLNDSLRAAYFTLGCKLNFAETSTIGRILSDKGVLKAQPGETPDVCVINTCSVTETADKKGRSLIRRIHSLYPDATIIVTGCYAQLKANEVAEIEGVDIVLGSNEKLALADYLENWLKTHRKEIAVTFSTDITEFQHSCEHGDRTRYFLKVQDGCDYYCTYCTIPYARGRSRSPRIAELVAEAEKVAREGGKEIVLTGVNIGDFGKNQPDKSSEKETFFDLIRALDEVEGIERYRISSIEPNLLTEEIIHWVANESRAFMPHFHIPLQAGTDDVLKLMNRRYNTELFSSRIEMIRKAMPDAFIGVDVIVGARGETEELWKESYCFIANLDVTRLHVFPYSERPGTAALKIDKIVKKSDKTRRVTELTNLSEKKLYEFMQRQVGKIYPVLWEQPAAGSDMMHGFTPNYIRVSAPYEETAINQLINTRLLGIDEDDISLMKGELLEK